MKWDFGTYAKIETNHKITKNEIFTKKNSNTVIYIIKTF